ncbi:hypothetical protein B0I35DRAFT_449038 [Stachybotrys elegans]|uniref:Uncharacterized protein n=1 Tax=Stachybotrys elegans TaxID=80388 RepID=A0A8K0WVL8_9HYPO|nr:hypothetical protein B0I35DRAFT_449038 [Stachybotrys elegans]
MLLNQDDIPQMHTILAAFFVWLLLAGFLVFPGTFTNIEESIENGNQDAFATQAASAILSTSRNIPLLVIASTACGIAVLGMLYLAIEHRNNYIWLLNKLLLPGATNGLAGLISTLIGVYSQQDGEWNITALVTAIVEASCVVICGMLFIIFKAILLRSVQRKHGEKMKKKALAPGSVV